MKTPESISRILRVPILTRTRIFPALAVAVVADGLEILLGPLGWVIVDPIVDVVAMILTTLLLGFHWLLLPTFVLKLIPVVDELPTWTACVAAVIALRKHAQKLEQEAMLKRLPQVASDVARKDYP